MTDTEVNGVALGSAAKLVTAKSVLHVLILAMEGLSIQRLNGIRASLAGLLVALTNGVKS